MTTTKRRTTTSDLPEGVDKHNHSIYNSKPSSPVEEASDATSHGPEDHTFVPKHHQDSSDISDTNKPSFLALRHQVYSLVKNTITSLSATVFGLVITALVVLLIVTNSSLFSAARSLEHPVPGLTSKFSVVDTPFIVPDLFGKHRKDSASTQENGPKKAPGDFGTNTGDNHRPAAAAGGAAASKTEQSDSTDAATTSLDSDDSKSVVYIDNPDKTPPLIIVTAIDIYKFKPDYVQAIIKNRRAYAERHGFGLYIRYVSDFDEWKSSNNKSPSWAKLAVLRAALHAFPHAKHFWYLDQHGVISNPNINVIEDIVEAEALGKLMLRDEPISKDSPIHTYKNTLAKHAKFIISRNPTTGLDPASFIIANVQLDAGGYAKSLLDFWNDPLIRNYPSFEDGDASALDHIMTWHPVYLSRTALVPMRTIAGYRLVMGMRDLSMTPEDREKVLHQPDDLAAFLVSCETGSSTYCMRDVAEVLNHQEPAPGQEPSFATEKTLQKEQQPAQPVAAKKEQQPPQPAAAKKEQQPAAINKKEPPAEKKAIKAG